MKRDVSRFSQRRVPHAVAVVLALSACWVNLAAQADEAVRSFAEPARVDMDGAVTLAVRVDGPLAGGAAPGEVSPSPSFRLMLGPVVERREGSVGGRVYPRLLITYVFAPLKAGTLALPPVSVRLGDGSVVPSPTVTVEVFPVQGETPPTPDRPPVAGAGGGPAPQQPGSTRSATGRSDLAGVTGGGPLFLRMSVSRGRATLGEPVEAALWLGFSVPLRKAAIEREGKMPGFWIEEWAIPGDPDEEATRRGGRTVTWRAIRKWVLFPISAGRAVLDPWKVQALSEGSDDPIGGGAFDLSASSEPVTVIAEDFPEAGKPPGFSGLCGQFRMTVQAQPVSIKLGGSARFTVTVEGRGNLRALRDITPPTAPGARVTLAGREEDVQLAGGSLEGRVRWEFAVAPLAPGDLALRPEPLWAFDPSRREYVKLWPDAARVAVSGGGAAPADQSGRPEQPVSGGDIRFIHPAPFRSRGTLFFHESTAFFSALASAPLLAACVLWFRSRRRRALEDPGTAVAKSARDVRKALGRMKRCCVPADGEPLISELGRGWRRHLGLRFGLEDVACTPGGIREALERSRLPGAEASDFTRRLESVRFAPGCLDLEKLHGLASEGGRVMDILDGGGQV